MNKPSLKDRRRTEARDALYRAQERRDHLIDALVRNANHMKMLRQKLKRLDAPVLHTGPVSVAEGKLLDPTGKLEIDYGSLNDKLPDHLRGED